MSIIETIKKRTSVRSFGSDPIDGGKKTGIREFIRNTPVPFGAGVRIELIEARREDVPVKLGTYGVIRGAADFLAAAYRESPMAEYATGYLLEQVVLYCTSLGLGTCWVGGTFRQDDFAQAVSLRPEEMLRTVVPVGYVARRRTMIDSLFGAMVNHSSRKKFEELFFAGSWDTPLRMQDAEKYVVPLEMVRLAPSARNAQPWRAVYDGHVVHFYRKPSASRFTKIDLGIALCHFEQSCLELEIGGSFQQLQFGMCDQPKEFEYVISWVEK